MKNIKLIALLFPWFIIGVLLYIHWHYRLVQIIYLDTKKEECIKASGQYVLRDWSWNDDNSNYKATCTQPEKKLWEIQL